MKTIKFRLWTGVEMYYPADLYFFEEEGIRNVENGKGDGHYATCYVMQFTGLQDSKGKDIYEGDIIKVYGSISTDDPAYGNYEPEYEVIWGQCSCSWILTGCGERLTDCNEYEIIGNIHEHKNLLK